LESWWRPFTLQTASLTTAMAKAPFVRPQTPCATVCRHVVASGRPLGSETVRYVSSTCSACMLARVLLRTSSYALCKLSSFPFCWRPSLREGEARHHTCTSEVLLKVTLLRSNHVNRSGGATLLRTQALQACLPSQPLCHHSQARGLHWLGMPAGASMEAPLPAPLLASEQRPPPVAPRGPGGATRALPRGAPYPTAHC
jgi:hypothetical protein